MTNSKQFDHYPRPNIPIKENVWRNKYNPQPGDFEHVCYDVTCPKGYYYVTAMDAGRTYYMAGPYSTHAEALALVDKVRDIADKHDGRAWFMSWGTVRCANDTHTGALNKHGLI